MDSTLFLDIETDGLDWEKHQILAIGIKFGEGKIILDNTERRMLQLLNALISKYSPSLIVGHNIQAFDVPFIINRCLTNNIQSVFRFRSATNDSKYHCQLKSVMRFGEPIRYREVVAIPDFNFEIIDTMHQAIIHDSICRELPNYGLKDCGKFIRKKLGLKVDKRPVLSYQEIQESFTNNRDLFKEYLEADLDDTEVLFNFFHPVYQGLMELVSGLTATQSIRFSNARIWQIVLEQAYELPPSFQKRHSQHLLGNELIKPDSKIQFQGAYRESYPGLAMNVRDFDIKSMYPSIMLQYKIHSRKDPQAKMLQYLARWTADRNRLKKSKDAQSQQLQLAMKTMNNSAYGLLGCTTSPFNDVEAAASVTRIGRELIESIVKRAVSLGSLPLTVDTDGLAIHGGAATLEELQSCLPPGIELEFKGQYDWLFVPIRQIRKNEWIPTKSTYVGKLGGKIIVNGGRYTSRNNVGKWKFCYERGFVMEYIKGGFTGCDQYHQDWINKIQGTYTNKRGSPLQFHSNFFTQRIKLQSHWNLDKWIGGIPDQNFEGVVIGKDMVNGKFDYIRSNSKNAQIHALYYIHEINKLKDCLVEAINQSSHSFPDVGDDDDKFEF